jgi:hypothetical protein
MPYRRRIWSEMQSSLALAEPRVLELLRRFGIAPIVAVWPSTPVATVARAVQVIEGEGLPVAIWPMLDDGDGRWANTGNAEVFARFVEAFAHALGRLGRSPGEVVIDLEPPIEEMRASVAKTRGAVHARFLPIAAARRSFAAGRARLRALGDTLRRTGARVSAVVPPTVLLDPAEEGPRPFQELFGTPVDGLAWDHVSVMLYTSIIEGWSRGVLRRQDARALLGIAAGHTAARFGDRAGASLGAVDVGAFGDEPIYRSPRELADDVAIAIAAGIDDLALFDLRGVLRRGDPEAWLEAFTSTEPIASVPLPTNRVRAVLAGARLAGGALGTLGRFGG